MPQFNHTPEGRRLARAYGSLGGLSTSARNDVLTAAGRARTAQVAGYATGHGCSVCPQNTLPDDLAPAERERRIVAMRREHYTRLALKRWRRLFLPTPASSPDSPSQAI